MSIKDKNIFEDIDFSKNTDTIINAVKIAVEKFWEQDIKITLRAINDFRELRDEKLLKNTNFFSSSIKVEKHKPLTVRLSGNFIQNFLDITLDSKEKFSLSDLTPLEIKILNSFSEFLYRRLKDVLISEKDLKLTEKSEKNVSFLFLLGLKNGATSEILVTIPLDRIDFKNLQKVKAFNDEDFRASQTIVRIQAGSSKITLEELNNLSKEDIVLLENSDSSKLVLISGEYRKKFNVKVNPSLVLNIDDEEHSVTDIDNNTNNEVIMEKNLWDDIQIEINAEFEKVKMTIGELKQITQGQVVDLGSVFDNEISLFVEDKKVAKGELIIINDRYAVRLNEVLSSKMKENIEVQAKTTPNPAAKPAVNVPPKGVAMNKPAAKAPLKSPQAAKPKVAEDEQFDYSDFEK